MTKVEKIFLIIALIYGILFSFLVPPFQVPDEKWHFYKAFSISEGHIFPTKYVVVPKNVKVVVDTFNSVKDVQKKIYESLNLPITQNKVAVDISNVSIYPPIPYLFSSLIFMALKSFSPLILMYIARLVNLIVWITLLYFAIKITPIHKRLFLALSLMPMTIHQAASLSPDSFTIGISFLAIAVIYNYVFGEEKIKRRDFALILILMLILAFSKPGYALLSLIFLMIPSDKFPKRTKILDFIVIIFVVFSLLVVWCISFKGYYTPSEDPAVRPNLQFNYVVTHPLEFIKILGNTISTKLNLYLIMFVGCFGHLNVYLPEFLVYAYLFMLFFISLSDNAKFEIHNKQKLIAFFTFLLLSFLIFLFEYLTWTPVGYNTILGVQGRYFIPISPLFFMIFHNKTVKKLKIKTNRALTILILFILFCLSFSVFKLLEYYWL
ncbi:Protein of unknown function DUF2142, membrane [Methanothermus fervidus DSM 2088]|uniref:DUF2142 domain-containing protein n=1 Tax=Methanothermus fervidus (strain ATCC 43054 / DSM 2088 / JCM 10308 / V24 S) TaxID=523846 RepID=E3GWD1_METFV|nr:DUF2142 domain-containing protein [Methanothermus fervidus]ADP77896.1 Protein of unknown function DUF2142, membrane [Methanothermus fervidus DSM 2088]